MWLLKTEMKITENPRMTLALAQPLQPLQLPVCRAATLFASISPTVIRNERLGTWLYLVKWHILAKRLLGTGSVLGVQGTPVNKMDPSRMEQNMAWL